MDEKVVGGVRQLLQHLVTPDLRALKERVIALEKQMELRFAHVDQGFEQVDKDIVGLRAEMNKRFERAENAAEHRHSELLNFLSLDQRLRRLEDRQPVETKQQ